MEGEVSLEPFLVEMIRYQKLAVLATQSTGQPYASLVSFAATPDLKNLIFATTRSTRKYANLQADSRVAMLVDDRQNRDTDIHRAAAVTATGTVEEVPPADRDEFLKIYLSKHPYLKEFVQSPTCALLRVHVNTYYVVRRFQTVMELHISP
jgi:nitroimidazol reductase NimA-like FMN-containing flavoprotein (pyridoxamine 5'-phosphate oxidase superfamily)